MPLEICFIESLDDTEEYNNFLVEREMGVLVGTFYCDGEEVVLGIECDRSDKGAVSIYPADGMLARDHFIGETLEHVELPPFIGRVAIGPRSPHDQVISDEKGNTGILRTRYASPNKITESLLVPMGLMYPDTRVHIQRP